MSKQIMEIMVAQQRAAEKLKDTTFALRENGQVGHYALVSGRVYGPWPDKGAAQAGLETEQRRAEKRANRGPAKGSKIETAAGGEGSVRTCYKHGPIPEGGDCPCS